MRDPVEFVRSAVNDLLWPGLPDGPGAAMLAMQFQLEQTQWWQREEIEEAQFAQFAASCAHAYETIPFHRARLDAAGFRPGTPIDRGLLRRLPLLERGQVQEMGQALLSTGVPVAHGRVASGQTSGSTGRPVTYYSTDISRFFWRAFTLRDHLWHRRDLSAKLAAIRPLIERGGQPGWGPSTDAAFHTGPSVMLRVTTHVDEQLAWLAQEAPSYLITNAHNLLLLAQRSLERGIRLPSLREARSFGGVLPPDVRGEVRQAWGVPVTDIYTSEEVGYLALQCPQHEHYHLQSENLLVEILDEAGEPCRPGGIGKVVVSTLHNFAMPLIRYELGDYAETGPPCDCGRGLPVIARILGRQRNLMTLPDGSRRWPSFHPARWTHVAPVRQMQLLQKAADEIVLKVVPVRALAAAERDALAATMREVLGYPGRLRVEEVAEIPRSASGKFEDFISEIER